MRLASAKIRRLTVTVCKVDIVLHSVDAIVNVLRCGQTVDHESGQPDHIVPADQANERTAFIKEEKRNLPPIKVFMTKNGMIHVHEPDWSWTSQSEQEIWLETCIRRILEVAEKDERTSIAIPAIGCGHSGINADIGIPSIIKAVSNYFQRHPMSCITQVDFVESIDEKVLGEFLKALNQIVNPWLLRSRPSTPQTKPRTKRTPAAETALRPNRTLVPHSQFSKRPSVSSAQENIHVGNIAPKKLQHVRRVTDNSLEFCSSNMDEYDVVVRGFPTAMNRLKIKLFVKEKFQTEFEVSRFGEGLVGFNICNTEDIDAFSYHDMKEVQFGSESYPLIYLKLPKAPQDVEKRNTVCQAIQSVESVKDRPPPPLPPKPSWMRLPTGSADFLPPEAPSIPQDKKYDNVRGSRIRQSKRFFESLEAQRDFRKEANKLATVEIAINKDEYRTISKFCIMDDLKHRFANASFKFLDDRNLLAVTSNCTEIPAIQTEMSTMRNGVESREMKELSIFVQRYLNDTAEPNQEKIQDEIQARNIKAEFVVKDGHVWMKSRCLVDHHKAVNVIKNLIWVSKFKVPSLDVTRWGLWKKFLRDVIAEEDFIVYEKDDKCIDIVGFKKVEGRWIQNEFQMFCDVHENSDATVQLSICEANFVADYCEKFNVDNPKRKALKHFKRHGLTGKLSLKGTEESIQKAKLVINHIVAGIVVEKHSRSGPGIETYYLDQAQRGLIESIRRSTNCYIEVRSPEASANAADSTTPKQTSCQIGVSLPKTCLFSSQLGKLTLTTCKADIVTHTVDAIVNIITHSNNMTLHATGVSGAIKKYDVRNENRIQKEMTDVKSKKGNLPPTEAFITSAGNLPNCRKIIHLIGPEWSGVSEIKQNALVSSCIRRILQMAQEARLSSIAIPAIGCGATGINPDIGVPRIVHAVSQYFQQQAISCTTRVDFVECNNQNVLDQFKKALEHIGAKISILKPPPSLNLRSIPVSSVILQYGNIADQKADAVVNIMAKDHIADMTKGSAIAKALAASAGTSVVKECAQKSGQYNDGDVFETNAGSLPFKRIFHGIVSSYDSNSVNIVKKIVKTSLLFANRANYRSIAFPAIGTGNFKMPANEVAKWMKEAIESYRTKDLCVQIVLYPPNTNAASAFVAQFNQSSMSPPSVNYGPVNVCITGGDITQRHDDVIVNSIHSSFDLTSGGPVSATILRKGGPEIQKELKDSKSQVCITSGGKLPCKNIIHLASPTQEVNLKEKIVKALIGANMVKASSIAFPAIGTGSMKMSAKSAASQLHLALQEYAGLPKVIPFTLKTITVVIYEQKMLKYYIETLIGGGAAPENAVTNIIPEKTLDDFELKRKAWKNGLKGFADYFPLYFDMDMTQQTVEFHFYASDSKDIVKALKCIDNKTKEVIHERIIEDDALAAVTNLEMLEFQHEAKERNVSIQKLPNKSSAFLVAGFHDDIRSFVDYTKNILRELGEAQTCVEYITWEMLDDDDNNWYGFPPRPAHSLEKAYQKKDNLGQVKIKVVEGGRVVMRTYDLSTLDQVNAKIKRRQTEKYELPFGWDPMQGAAIKRVELTPSSEEYKKVLNYFQQKGLTARNATIERIQNIGLYKRYEVLKAEVTKKLEGQDFRIERELFHGTKRADDIVNGDFDRGFAGENAAVYGNGVYFATEASYSHRYTEDGARTVFLANVITGAYAQGARGMKAAPKRSDNGWYNSVVDDIKKPTMYVVFKDASAYPTYLMKYS